MDVKIETLDLRSLFEDVKEEVQLKEGQVAEINIVGELRTLNSDPRILRNILINLLSNASKYSEKDKKITISAESKGNAVEISIADEGIGIPESDTRHVFDRFFRASNSGNIQGTGLGLNIVKRYVDLLKGSIWFKSENKKGTIFFVSIPERR
ncbi:MAG: sensor histidine kinase [Bacteroidota bacterium]